MDGKRQGGVAAPKSPAARVSAYLLHPAQQGVQNAGQKAGSGNGRRLAVQSKVQRARHANYSVPREVMVLPYCCCCSS